MSEVFLGRTEEQEKFTEILRRILDTEDSKYYIFLLQGTGGIGKTSLLRKLREIVEEKFPNQFNTLFLDWEDRRNQNDALKVGHDRIEPTTVLEEIYKYFCEQGWQEYLSDYLKNRRFWEAAENRIVEALEEPNLEDSIVQELHPLGVYGILELLRETKANEEEEEFTLAEGFLNKHLSDEELEICLEPNDRLARCLGKGVAAIAKEKPLVVFFDTYEIVDRPECDYTLREVISSAKEPIVWVIAGRTDLKKTGLRDPAAREALQSMLSDENQDADVIAIAIRLLGDYDNALAIQSLVKYLNHEDRYVREAAARELGRMTKYEVARAKVLKEAHEFLIQVMRNNYISDVREAARNALLELHDQIKFGEKQLLSNREFKKVERALWTELNNLSQADRDKLDLQKTWELLKGEKDKTVSEIENDNSENLLSYLQYPVQEIRERSIELLGDRKYQGATDILVDLLDRPNEDPDVRAAAAISIGKIGLINENTFKVLYRALNSETEKDRYVRSSAAIALSKLSPTKATVEALNKAVRQDVISNVRNAAKKSLETIGDSATDSALTNLAKTYLKKMNLDIKTLLDADREDDDPVKTLGNHQDADKRAVAALNLGKRGDSAVLGLLLARLKEEDDRIVRQAIIDAIGKIRASQKELDDLGIIDTLIDRWRNDPISDVRTAVEFAMKEIYKSTRSATIHKALKRYSQYFKDKNQKDKYDNFFKDYPLSQKTSFR
ncbi:MAG: HEAT repeat domain-containing protein [Cyanobacteriota bacterium]|nr:HEAT repeat domain-containing protein [Cyanobacteriota bacterium]